MVMYFFIICIFYMLHLKGATSDAINALNNKEEKTIEERVGIFGKKTDQYFNSIESSNYLEKEMIRYINDGHQFYYVSPNILNVFFQDTQQYNQLMKSFQEYFDNNLIQLYLIQPMLYAIYEYYKKEMENTSDDTALKAFINDYFRFIFEKMTENVSEQMNVNLISYDTLFADMNKRGESKLLKQCILFLQRMCGTIKIEVEKIKFDHQTKVIYTCSDPFDDQGKYITPDILRIMNVETVVLRHDNLVITDDTILEIVTGDTEKTKRYNYFKICRAIEEALSNQAVFFEVEKKYHDTVENAVTKFSKFFKSYAIRLIPFSHLLFKYSFPKDTIWSIYSESLYLNVRSALVSFKNEKNDNKIFVAIEKFIALEILTDQNIESILYVLKWIVMKNIGTQYELIFDKKNTDITGQRTMILQKINNTKIKDMDLKKNIDEIILSYKYDELENKFDNKNYIVNYGMKIGAIIAIMILLFYIEQYYYFND